MPVTGDFSKLKRFWRIMAQLAVDGKTQERTFGEPAIRAVKDLVKDQFRRGVDPSGSPQQEIVQGHKRKRGDRSHAGEHGLRSTALSHGAIEAMARGPRIFFFAKGGSKLSEMLDAHQKGHTFGARTSRLLGAGGKWATRKEIRAYLRAKKLTTVRTSEGLAYVRNFRNGTRIYARSKNVTERNRILPARQIYPDSLSERWDTALAAAISGRLEKFLGRFT